MNARPRIRQRPKLRSSCVNSASAACARLARWWSSGACWHFGHAVGISPGVNASLRGAVVWDHPQEGQLCVVGWGRTGICGEFGSTLVRWRLCGSVVQPTHGIRQRLLPCRAMAGIHSLGGAGQVGMYVERVPNTAHAGHRVFVALLHPTWN